MKKILCIVIIMCVAFAIAGCDNTEPVVEENAYADVKIDDIDLQINSATIYAQNIAEKGQCKFDITFLKQNSNVDTTTYDIETSEIVVSEGNFHIKVSKKEGYMISVITVYSLQNGKWKETDFEAYGIVM